MEHDFDIAETRLHLATILRDRNPAVRIRLPEEFHQTDDSILYAESLGREMYVSVINDVNWTKIDTYQELSDEFRNVTALYVNVPNTIFGQDEIIIDLFDRWFLGSAALP